MKKTSILILLFILPIVASAQGVDLLAEYQMEIILVLLVLVGLVTILALLVAWSGLNAIVRERRIEKGMETESVLLEARPGEENVGFWARFWNRFNSAVPIDLEESVATDHEYDGIKELDNRLPPWWLYGFYFTIIVAIVYIFHYEVFGSGLTQDEEYQAQMAEANTEVQAYLATLAEEEGEIVMELLTDKEAIAAGAKTFKVNCAQCHAADGGGMNALGPNLTDKYWKHGGDFDGIVATIQTGVSGTSMIPWESQLRASQIQEVASFVYSLEGTTPAVSKDPEGELFERSTVEPEATPSDSTTVES